MIRRSARALREPPESLAGFPSGSTAGRWFREHEYREDAADGGCWFFRGTPEDCEPQGRFDLALPEGTCYLAGSAPAAVRERCGRFMAAHHLVPRSLVVDRLVSEVRVKMVRARVADATHDDAPAHGVTRELFTVDDYGLTSRWAHALRSARFGALVYQPRFSTGNERACALFGIAGSQPENPVVRSRPTADVLGEMGIPVVAAPGRSVQARDDLDVLP